MGIRIEKACIRQPEQFCLQYGAKYYHSGTRNELSSHHADTADSNRRYLIARSLRAATPPRAGSAGALVGGVSQKLFSRDPGRLLSTIVSGGAFQNPIRLDDSDPVGRGFHTGEQIYLWHSVASHQPQDIGRERAQRAK